MKKVLVIGATGYLGNHVVKQLKQQGYWIRVLIRDPKKATQFKDLADDCFIGEATKPLSLNNCCDGIDVVFSSLGITRQKEGQTYMDVDYQANQNILNEALKSGVKKFIYTSVLNADKLSHLKVIQAKEKFVASLIHSGINYSIIRPSGFFSDMKEYYTMALKGKAFLFGKGSNKINPIHGEDLAAYCVNSIENQNKEHLVGGPEIFTHEQIIHLAYHNINKPPKIAKIPIWIKTTMLSLARCFTSVKTFGPLEFLLTVLTTDMVGEKHGKQTLQQYFTEIALNDPS
jgi:uncharacterized protein YbjT (DUF2867 family)